jgi:hypothetical protein
MFREIILPIFRSTRLCVTACGIMHRRCCRPEPGNNCIHQNLPLVCVLNRLYRTYGLASYSSLSIFILSSCWNLQDNHFAKVFTTETPNACYMSISQSPVWYLALYTKLQSVHHATPFKSHRYIFFHKMRVCMSRDPLTKQKVLPQRPLEGWSFATESVCFLWGTDWIV